MKSEGQTAPANQMRGNLDADWLVKVCRVEELD